MEATQAAGGLLVIITEWLSQVVWKQGVHYNKMVAPLDD